jgi:hypothetical protein
LTEVLWITGSAHPAEKSASDYGKQPPRRVVVSWREASRKR